MEKTLETHGPASESHDHTLERSHDVPRSGVREQDEGPAPIARTGSPFFADLVRAHYAWEQVEDAVEDRTPSCTFYGQCSSANACPRLRARSSGPVHFLSLKPGRRWRVAGQRR